MSSSRNCIRPFRRAIHDSLLRLDLLYSNGGRGQEITGVTMPEKGHDIVNIL